MSPPGVVPEVVGLLVREASEGSGQTTLVNKGLLFYLAKCVAGPLGFVSKSQPSRVHNFFTLTLTFASFIPPTVPLHNRISILGIPDWPLAGLVIGLAGVTALVGIDVAGRPDELIGAAAVTAAAVGYAVGAHIFKRYLAGIDARAAMGICLVFAACALTPTAIATRPVAAPTTPVVLAVVALGIVCTGAGLALFGMLIADAGVGRALVS